MDAYEKIIGYKDIVAELKKIGDVLKNSGRYREFGVKIPKGLFLFGEPGVGKTLLATALMEDSGRKVFVCRKDEPNGKFVSQINDTFSMAAENEPSIIFFDDLDKFANEDERRPDCEEYVAIQSGIDKYKNKDIFIIATANNRRRLPDSLLRPGRFDKKIKVEFPTGEDAAQILAYYLKDKKLDESVDVTAISRIMQHASCAVIESLMNEAGLRACYLGKTKVEMEDIVEAYLTNIQEAPECDTFKCTQEKRKVAYHEAGHAVIAELLEPGSVTLVTVSNRAGEIGGTTSYYQSELYFTSKKYMGNRVMSLLAGKVATELVFGETDVGSGRDTTRAFDIVERFIAEYCDNGYDKKGGSRYVSDQLLRDINISTALQMDEYSKKVQYMLVSNRAFLDEMANALMKKRVLIAKDIKKIKEKLQID